MRSWLISPQLVKPFVKSQKNDRNDAEAIVVAAIRPTMRFVPIKEKWQQDIQALHRIRARLVHNKTALSNQIRGLLTAVWSNRARRARASAQANSGNSG